MSQHKATLRRTLQSSLSHRRLANELLDSLADSQTKWNSAMDKADVEESLAIAEVTEITTVADVGGSLDGTYFILQETVGSVAFWIDVDDSGTVEPAHGADRSVEIATISTGDSAADVATAVAAAIDGDGGFAAPAPGAAVIEVTNDVAGDVTDATAETSGFSMNVTTQGEDADSGLDTNYEATLSITDIFEADGEGEEAQHKASLRQSLRSALSHKRLADEIADAMEEMQTAYNALLVKLDAESGTLNDTDYESSLSLSPIDPESSLTPGQHKASMRRSLRSALKHTRLADILLDAIKDMQDKFNAALAELDGGDPFGNMAQYKVSVIDPDAGAETGEQGDY